ncbi:MAG: S-adenosylmethionine:tRNA ribosyltransferase-isomerase [Planctomycetota bacterium]|jgi:S-adenosylmethionine:tRNA ribosyltransferase-isomerase
MNHPDPDLLSAWQFDLPPELIADRPAPRREDARLLVVDRRQQQIRHAHVRELPGLLECGDLLVFNNTKVLPARLFGIRTATGGRWEGLYIEQTATGDWVLMCDTRGKLQPGETITVIPAARWAEQQARPAVSPGSSCCSLSLTLQLLDRGPDGTWIARPESQRSPAALLEDFGSLPLPPYMKRKVADQSDNERYQTTFAAEPGAIAAPTAGLHFTPELLGQCASAGIHRTEVTLHVGPGTFRPVTAERLSEHQMHEEWCRLPQTAVSAIRSKPPNGRLIAVGTTSVRTLESAALADNEFPVAWEGRTKLFIRPGFNFQAVQGLITNFHLPGSTLIVLVAALAGRELILEAYRQAIAERYRFYSYGDAMLIL